MIVEEEGEFVRFYFPSIPGSNRGAPAIHYAGFGAAGVFPG
jgi:hypothetical protein